METAKESRVYIELEKTICNCKWIFLERESYLVFKMLHKAPLKLETLTELTWSLAELCFEISDIKDSRKQNQRKAAAVWMTWLRAQVSEAHQHVAAEGKERKWVRIKEEVRSTPMWKKKKHETTQRSREIIQVWLTATLYPDDIIAFQ